MRTILLDYQSGVYDEIQPDQVASAAKPKMPLGFFATDEMIVFACVDWEYVDRVLSRYNFGGRPRVKPPGLTSHLISVEYVRVSGHLLLMDGVLRVMAWRPDDQGRHAADEFLNRCMAALGVTQEDEDALQFRRR